MMGPNHHVSTTLQVDWHFKGFPMTRTRSNGLQGTLFEVPCHVPTPVETWQCRRWQAMCHKVLFKPTSSGLRSTLLRCKPVDEGLCFTKQPSFVAFRVSEHLERFNSGSPSNKAYCVIPVWGFVLGTPI